VTPIRKRRRTAASKTKRVPARVRPRTGPARRSRQDLELRDYIALQEKISRGLRGFIDQMTAVFRFIETISEFHSLDRILELLLAAVRELFPYQAAAVYLEERPAALDLSGQTLKREASFQALAACRQRLGVDESLLQWVFRQGHPIVLPADLQTDSGSRGSFVLAPLATSVERLGRLELLFDRPEGEFTQQAFSILGVLCKHAALIIANERGYEQERRVAQKYMELDRFKQDIVHTTPHEIKTPLTIINASAIMLRRELKGLGPEHQKLLDSVIRQCRRINRVVDQLVESALLEENRVKLKLQALSLPDLTLDILHDLPYDAGRLEFQLQFPPDLGPAMADYDCLARILCNLVENAVKYSPRGGVITISGENQDQNVVWQIRDQGVGIPEADQDKIFEKFYRVGDSTTRDVQGMGFGLYIVKKNIELNGGTIGVKSKVGEGSTFTVVLPRASR
jgi:signal transduction histidine kinase